jgi:outer membrane lipoprotein-sorting protein
MLEKCTLLLGVLPLILYSQANSAVNLDEIVEEMRIRSVQSHDVIHDFTLVEDLEMKTEDGTVPLQIDLKKRGRKFRMELSLKIPNGTKEVRSIIIDDGEGRWTITPFGMKEVSREDREASRMLVDFLLPPSLSSEMNIVGQEIIGEREAVIIEVQENVDLPYDRIWLDTERLVPLKMVKLDSEEREVTLLFHDYQKIEGLWGLPFSTEIYYDGVLTSTMKVRNLKVNTGFPNDLFDPVKVTLENLSELQRPQEPGITSLPTTVTLGRDATLTPPYNFSGTGKDATGLGFALASVDLPNGEVNASAFGLSIYIFIPIPFDGSINYNSGPADASSFGQIGETFNVVRGDFPAPAWFANVRFHVRYKGDLFVFPPDINIFGFRIQFGQATTLIFADEVYGDDKGEESLENNNSFNNVSATISTTMELVEGKLYEPFIQIKTTAQANSYGVPYLPAISTALFGGIPFLEPGSNGVTVDSIVIDFVEEPEPPFCKIQDPKYGETVCDTVSIVAVAIDNFAMDSVVFFINNVKVFTDTGPAYRYNWVSNAEADGEHELRIKAVDYFENIGEDTILVSVNNNNPLDIEQDSLSLDYCPGNPWTQPGLLEFEFDIVGTADLFEVHFSSDDLLHQTLDKKIAGHDINFVPQEFAFLPSGIPVPIKAFVQIPIGQHEGVYEGFFRVTANGGCVGGQDSVHVSIEICPLPDMDIKDDYANLSNNVMEIQAISRANSEGSEWALRAFDIGLPHNLVENHDEYDGPGNTPMDCITCEFEEWSPLWHEDDHDHHFHTNFRFTGTGSVMGDSCDWGAGEWRRMFIGLMVPPMKGQDNKPGTYKGRLNCWAILEGDTVDHDYFDIEVKLARIVGPPSLNSSSFGGDPTDAGIALYWGDFTGVGIYGGVKLYRENPKTGNYLQINDAPETHKSTYLDTDVIPGISYNYKLGIENNGTELYIGPLTVGGTGLQIPKSYALFQNIPNPFNQSTAISYQLRASSHTTLKVYDLTGRQVRTLVNEEKEAGYYSVNWDKRDAMGKEVANGIYFYRLTAGDFIQTRKMILMK